MPRPHMPKGQSRSPGRHWRLWTHQPIADQHNEFCVSDLEGSQPSNCRCYQEGRVEKVFFTRVECFTVSNALEKSREIIVTVSSVLSMDVSLMPRPHMPKGQSRSPGRHWR